MKKNIITINIMVKKSARYICLFLALIGAQYYAFGGSHTLSVQGSVANVTISVTSPSSIAESSSASVEADATVTLSYSSIAGGTAWKGWNVHKTGDASTTIEVDENNQFTMPDYDVTVDAFMYSSSKLKTRCLDFRVTGDVHLTSYAGVEVFTTSSPDNLITVQCDHWNGADRLNISYLNGSGETVAKASSLFRIYDPSSYNKLDASNDYITISSNDQHVEGIQYAIGYKPNADEYNQIDNWTLRLTAKNGATEIGHVDFPINGRALPEEFAIVTTKDNRWYALPNNIVDNDRAITPIEVTVDNPANPTAVAYTPSGTKFKGGARNSSTANRYAISIYDASGKKLKVSRNNNYVYLSSTGSASYQDWFLESSDFSTYTLWVPTDDSDNRPKKMGMSGSNMGNYYNPSNSTIYLLPVTNEITLRDATVTEWGQHSVILNVDASDAAHTTAHVENGTPTENQDITPINATAAKAKNFKVLLGDINLADLVNNEGKFLYIEWLDGSDNVLETTRLRIPRIIAESRNMKTVDESLKGAWTDKEVYVLPGATLTANTGSYSPSGISINELHIYPGATLNVASGALTATTLRLHNGWTRAGDKSYDVARVYIADDAALVKTTAAMYYDIFDMSEGRHYYPIAVPFHTDVKDIDYADATLASYSKYGSGGQYVIKRYNGATRAASGPVDGAWEVVGVDKTLQPGVGYIMTAIEVNGEAVIKIPLDYNDAWTADGEKGTANYDEEDHVKNVVAVTAHTGAATEGGGANNRHKGWNMLGVPFMSCYTSGTDMYDGEGSADLMTGRMTLSGDPADPYSWESSDVVYVSVPTHDFSEYIQTDITSAELVPGWSFFIQVGTTGNLTFLTTEQAANSNMPIYAPKREKAAMPVVKTGIVLSDGEKSDKTTFLISDKYSSDYEIGADLEKMFGNGYTLATYSINNDTRLAFNAMSTAQANELIPIGVRLPEDGEYTFSLNERYADADIERLDLIDYETGEVTDLMATDYIFYATRSQNDERFALNVQRGKETATDIGGADIGAPDGARKILLNGTIFIVRDGLLYDATGKRVQTNK